MRVQLVRVRSGYRPTRVQTIILKSTIKTDPTVLTHTKPCLRYYILKESHLGLDQVKAGPGLEF